MVWVKKVFEHHSVIKLSGGLTSGTAGNPLLLWIDTSRQIFFLRHFFPFIHDYFDCTASTTSLSPKFPYPPSPSLSHTAHAVEIDDSDGAWEAEAAKAVSSRVADVTSTVPCTGSAAKVRLFTADSASTQSGNHGDVRRGMHLSVINWHGWVLVVAGHCHMLLPSHT